MRNKKSQKLRFWPTKLPPNVRFDTDLIPFKSYAYFSLFLSLATIVGILVMAVLVKNLPPQVPLYYSLPEGEAQLAPTLGLILPSLASLAVLIVNIMVCFFLEDEFLKKALILTSIGVAFFATITSVKIILLVGSF